MEEEYYKSKESVIEYIRLAQGVNGRNLIEKLNGVLKTASTILELGSGPGTDWSILNMNYEVIGSDFSNEFIQHLKSKYPSGKFLNLDAISIETEMKFDGIYSNKVLQHLKDYELKESIEKQSKILRKDGIICHSFWKGEGYEIFKGMFVNYHTVDELDEFFSPYFDIITLELYKEFEENDSILLIAKKISSY